MADLTIIGLNHRTASVDVRERFALGDARQIALQRSLEGLVAESVVLCTCNRAELVFVSSGPEATARVEQLFAAVAGEGEPVGASSLYVHERQAALRHLFRVVAGLDSLVPGETQITGQVKSAFEAAFARGFAGNAMQQIYQRMLRCAKAVRTETQIGEGAVSVSSMAVNLARSIFDSLADKAVLLVGAGEMCTLAGESFRDAGVQRIVVANRTVERAATLAATLGGEACGLDQLPSLLVGVDIVLASTNTDGYIVTTDLVREAMRHRRGAPLFCIDIAVPRDIDPAINRLPDVYLYNIDDLQQLVERNLRDRRKEAERAEALIDAAVREWDTQVGADIGPLIVSLRERADGITSAELDKLFRQHPEWSAEERQRVERAVQLIVNKLLHDPIISLRRGVQDEATAHRGVAQMFRELFNLK